MGMSWITPPDWIKVGNWVLENFIWVDKPLTKTLRSLQTFVSVNNSLYGKLVSSLESPVTFYERFEANSVPYLIPEFNLLSREFNSLLSGTH